MRAAILTYVRAIVASYWLIPSLMVGTSILLGMASIVLDRTIGSAIVGLVPGVRTVSPDGARAILTTIASSMITVAGVTFSITIAAVSTAAAQYGPRVIGNFMRDRGNQITLGSFTAAFTYALIALQSIESVEADELFVPRLTVFLALLFAIGSVSMLIFFVHHIPEMLNVGNVTASIGKRLVQALHHPFPENVVDPKPHRVLGEGMWDVPSDEGGYVQALDAEALKEAAAELNADIIACVRPGDFLLKGDPLASLCAPPDPEREDPLDTVRSAFFIGKERTENQNPRYLIDQLIEILARALSPGVNDPFTAVACIDWLILATDAHLENEHADEVIASATHQGPAVSIPNLTHTAVLDAGIVRAGIYSADNIQVRDALKDKVCKLIARQGNQGGAALLQDIVDDWASSSGS